MSTFTDVSAPPAAFFGIRLGVLVALILSFRLHVRRARCRGFTGDGALHPGVAVLQAFLRGGDSAGWEAVLHMLESPDHPNLLRPWHAAGADAERALAGAVPPALAGSGDAPGLRRDSGGSVSGRDAAEQHLERAHSHRIDCG